MPVLGTLSLAGFSIWPFDPLRLPAVVEIYPRALTGRVVKPDVGARHRYLEARHPDLDPILVLPPARDETERLEGRIWISRPEGAASPLSQS